MYMCNYSSFHKIKQAMKFYQEKTLISKRINSVINSFSNEQHGFDNYPASLKVWYLQLFIKENNNIN